MRILSQGGLHDGIIDVPYEQVSIEQKENEIWCGYSSTMDRNCIGKCFAKYSTESKARKSMEMLHEAYCGNLHIYVDQFVLMAQHYASRPELLKLLNEAVEHVKYFRFPSDDEVEV